MDVGLISFVLAALGAHWALQPDMLGYIAEEYSRGWGHITTRQNFQFHFVELTRVPDLLREFALVGLTSREACGDPVRNVQGCHLAGACPHEQLDLTAWAEPANRHFLPTPIAQAIPAASPRMSNVAFPNDTSITRIADTSMASVSCAATSSSVVAMGRYEAPGPASAMLF